MKRFISSDELYPFWSAEQDDDGEMEKAGLGYSVDLSEQRWAEYDRVIREFEEWQQFLEKRYDARRQEWWNGLTEAEKREHQAAWARNEEESRGKR